MLNMRHKKEITAEVQARYKKAKKKQKKIILDEFVALTGYNRNYASRVLRLYYGKQMAAFAQEKEKFAILLEKIKYSKEIGKDFMVMMLQKF